MALKHQVTRTALNISLFLVVLISLFVNPVSVLAGGNGETTLPEFRDFSQTIQNGEANTLRGVYVPNVLALPVVQQPAGKPGFVSNRNGQATQFSMASQYGTVGLLAHNTLSGKSFSRLAAGQEVRLIFGDGKVEYFIITEILEYQALQPTSPWSTFRDLTTDETLTANDLFQRVYMGDRHVTFQTCIQAYGNWSWGRLFVVATPLP